MHRDGLVDVARTSGRWLLAPNASGHQSPGPVCWGPDSQYGHTPGETPNFSRAGGSRVPCNRAQARGVGTNNTAVSLGNAVDLEIAEFVDDQLPAPKTLQWDTQDSRRSFAWVGYRPLVPVQRTAKVETPLDEAECGLHG